MSRLLSVKTLPQQLAQPTGIAIAASLSIHALLALGLPSLSKASKQADQTSRDVKVVELTPAEESRVPPLTPSPSLPSSTPQVPPYESQPLPPPVPSLSYYPPTSPECSVNSPALSRRKKGESSTSSSSQAKKDKGVKSSLSEQYCLDDLLASGGITKPPKSIKDTPRSLKDKDSKKKLDKTSDRKNNKTSGYPLIDRTVGQNRGVPSGIQPENPNLLQTPALSSSSTPSGQADRPSELSSSNLGDTSSDKGREDYISWLQKVKSNYRELEPPKTIDKMIEYSCKLPCSKSKPVVAIAVVVDPQGRIVEEGKIGDAGAELNKKALAQVPLAVQKKLNEQSSNEKDKYKSFLVRFYPSGQ